MAPRFSSFNYNKGIGSVRGPRATARGFFLNNAPVGLGGPGPVNVQNSAPFTLSTTSPITCYGNFNVSVKLRGAPGAGPVTYRGVGGVVTGTVFFADGQSYNVVYDPKYSALFYGIDGSTAPVCIMLAAQGGGGNIAIHTNPSADVSLSVTGIPTDTTFDNTTISFTVVLNNTGTARSCTSVTLNGYSTSIKWFGGSLATAVAGVTTSNGFDAWFYWNRWKSGALSLRTPCG